jgi:hypothetical protein
MPHHKEPSPGPTPAELAERRRRFRMTIQQINAHQPARVVRALAADLRSRSRRP